MDAFAAVFEDLRPDVFRFAQKVVGENDAGDVAMDTFLKAWQGISGFDGRSSLKTWLFKIAYHCSIDFLRSPRHGREQPMTNLENEDGKMMDVVADSRKLPDAIVTENDDARLVSTALEQLPEEHRTALTLRYVEDLRYGEIATVTGVSIGTVMSRLFNGKQKLRRLLEPRMGG